MRKMTIDYEPMRFWDAYGIAEYIRQSLEENPEGETFDQYFDISQQDTMQRCLVPSRWTLLHQFTQDRYREARIEGFEYHRDDMRDLIIAEYTEVLRGYEIPVPQYDMPDERSDEYNMVSRRIISDLRQLLPIDRIVCETFHLLFANRLFLRTFNEMVANVIGLLKLGDFPDFLERDGMLLRAYLPVWAKRGVFYRDQGRCVLCGKDLTGTVVTGETLAYDHIVPLAVGGTNDPTNFQLLCRECNSSKSRRTITSDRYPVYWSINQG